MNIEVIKKLVAKATVEKKILCIQGYINSKGEVHDYMLKFGADYHTFVRESHTLLLKGPGNLKIVVEGLSQERIDAVKDVAVAELLKAFATTLDPNAPSRAPQPYVDSPEGWSTLAKSPEALYVRNLTIIKVEKRAGIGGGRVVNSADKTLVKAGIRKLTPLDKYLAQLKLVPGKFKNITVI